MTEPCPWCGQRFYLYNGTTDWHTGRCVRAYPCTTCGAQVGQPCRTTTTGKSCPTHQPRLDWLPANPGHYSGAVQLP
jgi:hypothetical protein